MTEIKTTASDSRAIPYLDEGEGPVTLVLVSTRSIEADGLGIIAHYLAEEAGFRVVRVGARDTADSARERADDVLAVIDELGIGDTWIGGHGAGGTASRVFAAEHGDRVNGLLLLGVEDEPIVLAPLIPVLIVQGASDEVTPVANAERLQASAPERASVKILEGADHLFPVTHPIEAAVIIEEYLDWD